MTETWITCPTCSGSRMIWRKRAGSDGSRDQEIICPQCDGDGRVRG